ncbi:outer membrane protein assembly factor BamD [Thiomicrospira sp. R3]|uniref:outer membrane protein assembly factor BamD n=1 Tax=Thiomicrospira sp. R3 TaxID=3035472 RepID=UPI00259B4F8D|nr:outer membrane protein assembly factor BamD [Thiomicrospira sp. R3]WFE68206.1 outer membrane protein assembly factor BamD [Thiomicrospira sp. R3]
MLKILSIILILSMATGCSSIFKKPESEWTVEEFYQKAKGEFDKGQWKMAIEYYEKLKANYPYGDHAEQAYLELAYAYYRYDEPLSAIRELDEFIRIYPRHPELAYAHYLKAVASDSLNRSWLDRFITDPAQRDAKSALEAYRAYQQVIQRFPDSQYAKASQSRLIVLTNQLARREMKIANYYYSRGAYLAAANRATAVIEHYPRSQSNRAALKLMHSAYTKLGMEGNAQTIQAIIDKNS